MFLFWQPEVQVKKLYFYFTCLLQVCQITYLILEVIYAIKEISS